MAISASYMIEAQTPDEFNTMAAAQIALGHAPWGAPFSRSLQDGRSLFCQEFVVGDPATVTNEVVLSFDIADGSAEAVYYLVSPYAGAIKTIQTVTDGVVSTADITITPKIGSTAVTGGVVTIATASSAAGDVDSATPSAANTVTAGQAINFTVTGGGAGGSPRHQ